MNNNGLLPSTAQLNKLIVEEFFKQIKIKNEETE